MGNMCSGPPAAEDYPKPKADAVDTRPGAPDPVVPTLLYLPVRARGESLRMLLAYGEIEYKDTIIPFAQWPVSMLSCTVKCHSPRPPRATYQLSSLSRSACAVQSKKSSMPKNDAGERQVPVFQYEAGPLERAPESALAPVFTCCHTDQQVVSLPESEQIALKIATMAGPPLLPDDEEAQVAAGRLFAYNNTQEASWCGPEIPFLGYINPIVSRRCPVSAACLSLAYGCLPS